MIIQLTKGNIIRTITGKNSDSPNKIIINGNKLDLTTDINLTHGNPLLKFIKNNNIYYIREKFNKTETITICAKTPNPTNSAQIYKVDRYLIPARAVNLSKLKIEVTITTQGSHRNDGPSATGYVILEAYNKENKIFSKKIWSDQGNGGDGAGGFRGGLVFNQSISQILSDNSFNVYDLYVTIYLFTGDYQAHVHGGQHRYQRVHSICVTVYD